MFEADPTRYPEGSAMMSIARAAYRLAFTLLIAIMGL
jgi:hypothetical protein